jgi:hypothetical protein
MMIHHQLVGSLSLNKREMLQKHSQSETVTKLHPVGYNPAEQLRKQKQLVDDYNRRVCATQYTGRNRLWELTLANHHV